MKSKRVWYRYGDDKYYSPEIKWWVKVNANSKPVLCYHCSHFGDKYTFQNNKFIDETGKIHRVTFQGLIAEEDSENDF